MTENFLVGEQSKIEKEKKKKKKKKPRRHKYNTTWIDF
jgi:hypothetical protein